MLYYHPISKNIAYSLSVVLKVIRSKLTMIFTNVISDSKTISGLKSLIIRSYYNLFNYKDRTDISLTLAYKTTERMSTCITDFKRNKYTKNQYYGK